MNLFLPEALEQEIARAALAAFPGECCGLVEGARTSDGFAASRLHPARNLAAAQDRFEIDPGDHLSAARAARAGGREIIGCYHSHPNGSARPSSHDLAGAGEENFLWLIAATDGAHCQLAGFVYSAGDFAPVSLGRAEGADLVTSSLNKRN
jgi:proteasome lid subunit RPN8/RPN11